MKKPFNSTPKEDWDSLRDQIIGLGKHSSRKTFYPELQKNISELKRFRVLLDRIIDGILLVDLESGKVVDLNHSACVYLGCDKKDSLYGRNIREIIEKRQLPFIKDFIDNPAGFNNHLETTAHFNIAGKTAFINLVAATEYFDDRSYVVIILRDITDNIRAEKEIEQQKENLVATIESTTDNIWSIDKEFKIMTMNSSFANEFRASTGNPVKPGDHILEKTDPKNRKKWKDRYERALLPESFTTEDIYIINGRRKYYETSFNPITIRGEIQGILVFSRDITLQKTAEEALISSEQKFRSMIESAPVGAAVIKDGMILYVNQALLDIFGYSDSSAPFKDSLFDYIHPDSREGFIEYFENTPHNHGIKYEAKCIRKDGRIIDVEINVSEINFGEKKANIFFVNNISEQKEIEKNLSTAKEAAEKSERLKTEFLAQMSHEIRTPINNILSFISLIKEEASDLLEDDLKEGFGIINNAGKRLIRTVDLILNMSEITTETYDLVFKEIKLYEDLMKELYLEFRQVAFEKGLYFKIHDSSEGVEINKDEYTVRQIFVNIIENALKYTHEGGIDITIGKTEKGRPYVAVKDTGIGIAEDFIDKIFEPFSQEYSGYTRPFEGNGLGLALVKKYCELNNAILSVESVKGEGSVFKVIF